MTAETPDRSQIWLRVGPRADLEYPVKTPSLNGMDVNGHACSHAIRQAALTSPLPFCPALSSGRPQAELSVLVLFVPFLAPGAVLGNHTGAFIIQVTMTPSGKDTWSATLSPQRQSFPSG